MISINSFNNFQNIDYKGLSSLLNLLDPIEFAIVGSILGIILSIPLTADEQNALGNFLILIGQEMLTIQSHENNKTPTHVDLDDFEKYKHEMNLKLEKIMASIKKNTLPQ